MKIGNEAKKYLNDNKNLEKLLLLEKKRRGIAKDNICFVATANIAGYWYCGMKSYYKGRRDELLFFRAYLIDRINCSKKLGLIEDLPEDKEKWLDIGNGISFKDINKLLKERKEYIIECIDDRDTKSVKDKFERGILYQYKLAEKYPSIRWNFKWDKYVVIAVPDGITDDFVYEFKSTASRFLLFFVKPVALTQAGLYGYFYKRKNKRVQIYLENERKIETYEDKVDINRALDTLKLFKKVEIDKKSIKPKKRWKCNNCEFGNICILINENH